MPASRETLALRAPLGERLRSPDYPTRLGALAGLCGPEADVAPHLRDVVELLHDEREEVRGLAVLVLGARGAARELGDALDRAQPAAIRIQAASALLRLEHGAEPALAPLLSSLRAGVPDLRILSSFALGAIGAPAVGPLRSLLSDPDSLVAASAADALGAAGAEARPAVADLRAACGRREPAVLLAASAALSKITGDASEGVPALVTLLERGDDATRADAARRLATLRQAGREAEGALLRRTKDPAPAVRANAAIALAAVGADDGKVLDAVAPHLGDSAPEVRSAAAIALAHLGPRARPALPALERVAQDPVPEVAAVGKAAVERVREAGGN